MNFFIYNDLAQPWQLGFQDGASPALTGIVELHDTIFFYLVFISVGVFWVLGSIIYFYNSNKTHIIHKYLNHGTLIELVWTITPALVLLAISFPSFRLLYLLDEVTKAAITLKVTGHQWYWSYEYSDYVSESGEAIEFDSYMIPDADLELGQFRLLDVDQRLIVPSDTHIRLILTSEDVIHNYAVPSLGLKPEAVPGRLNQTSIFTDREGIFYGQCSEICGVYHANMPTAVESVGSPKYVEFLGGFSFFLGFKAKLKSMFNFLKSFLNKGLTYLQLSITQILKIFSTLLTDLKVIFLLPAGPRLINSKLGYVSLLILLLAGVTVRSSILLPNVPETALNLIFIIAVPYVIYSLYSVTLKLIVMPQIFNILKSEYLRGQISLRVIFGYYFLNLMFTIFILLLTYWSFTSIVIYFELFSPLSNILNTYLTTNFSDSNLSASTLMESQANAIISVELLAFIFIILITSPLFILIAKILKVNIIHFNLDKILAIPTIFAALLIMAYLSLPFLGVIFKVLVPGISIIECQPDANTSENNPNTNNSTTSSALEGEGNNSAQAQPQTKTYQAQVKPNTAQGQGISSSSQAPSQSSPINFDSANFASQMPSSGHAELRTETNLFDIFRRMGVKSYAREEDMPGYSRNRGQVNTFRLTGINPNNPPVTGPANVTNAASTTGNTSSVIGANTSKSPVSNPSLSEGLGINTESATSTASVLFPTAETSSTTTSESTPEETPEGNSGVKGGN